MPGKHPITGANWNDVFDMASRSALEAIGLLLEREAVALTPRLTGRLIGSITHATVGGVSAIRASDNPDAGQHDAVSKPRSKHEVWIGTNVEYAPHVEYGTNQMRKKSFGTVAQPFLRPALDNNRKAVVELYAKQLDKVIKRGE